MAAKRVEFTLALNDNFSGRMALAKAAVETLHATMELRAATWEPHDWGTF